MQRALSSLITSGCVFKCGDLPVKDPLEEGNEFDQSTIARHSMYGIYLDYDNHPHLNVVI